jgi:hypothetical protein
MKGKRSNGEIMSREGMNELDGPYDSFTAHVSSLMILTVRDRGAMPPHCYSCSAFSFDDSMTDASHGEGKSGR